MTWTVATAGAALEFDPTLMTTPAGELIAVDTNHFFIMYTGADSDGFAEILAVDTSTWAVTTAAARLEHDTQLSLTNTCSKIDDNHFIGFYRGSTATQDSYAQVFTVNTTTWAVTTASARFLFATDVGGTMSCCQIDANHFINTNQGADSDGYAQTFVVNTTTWAVTTAADPLEFDTQRLSNNSLVQADDNHFLDVWAGGTAGLWAQILTVSTSTWAVTTANASLQVDTVAGDFPSCLAIDSGHFITIWQGASTDGFVQVLAVNTSTWAVTTAAARLEFDTQDLQNSSSRSIAKVDTNHFIAVWASVDTGVGLNYDGFAQIFEVNTTTWAVTTSTNPFEFDATQGEYNAISAMIAGTDPLTGTGGKFLQIYSGGGNDGFAQVLTAFNDAGGVGTSVKDIIGGGFIPFAR